MDRTSKTIIGLLVVLYIICIVCIGYLLTKYKHLNVITPTILDYVVYPIMVNNNSLIVGLK